MTNSQEQSESCSKELPSNQCDLIPQTKEQYDETLLETLKILKCAGFVTAKYMMTILEDDDIKQELFIAIWKSGQSYKEGSGTKWTTFVTNRVRMALYEAAYRRRRSKKVKDAESIPRKTNSEIISENKSSKLNFDGVSLDKDEWNIVKMRYMDDLSLKEISDRTNMSKLDVGVKIRSILKEIRRQRGIV